MLYAYLRRDALVERIEIRGDAPLPAEALWLDLHDPTEAERAAVEMALGIALPLPEAIEGGTRTITLATEGGGMIVDRLVLTPM